jgi:hypothetical protein
MLSCVPLLGGKEPGGGVRSVSVVRRCAMKKLLAAVVLVAIPLALHADVVELTTGEKFEGKIISKDESGVTLKVPFGLIIIEQKFIKAVHEGKADTGKKDDGAGKKDKDRGSKETELEERKLKTRVSRWMNSRNKLICSKCGGDGKKKCTACGGTGQQYADPYNKTTRG